MKIKLNTQTIIDNCDYEGESCDYNAIQKLKRLVDYHKGEFNDPFDVTLNTDLNYNRVYDETFDCFFKFGEYFEYIENV